MKFDDPNSTSSSPTSNNDSSNSQTSGTPQTQSEPAKQQVNSDLPIPPSDKPGYTTFKKSFDEDDLKRRRRSHLSESGSE